MLICLLEYATIHSVKNGNFDVSGMLNALRTPVDGTIEVC